jgi:arylformamidase
LKLSKIHDLTRVISSNMQVYPGDPTPELKPHSTLENNGASVTKITLGSHTGTHVDAGSHFLSDGNSIDDERLDKFVGEAMIIDVSGMRREGITAKDLDRHKVKRDDIILLSTGSGYRLTDFAYLEVSAAEWICKHSAKCVGIDTLSVEKYGRKDAPVHKLLLSSNVGIVENLANLERFVGKRLFFACLPLPLKGADGSPVRAVLFEMIK